MAETFTEFAIAQCFLMTRLFARIKMVGFQGLQVGDAFAVAAMVRLAHQGMEQRVLTIS